ncbi:MAG: hypothetical protein AAGF20_10350 [Pseudomonadota bacterium]
MRLPRSTIMAIKLTLYMLLAPLALLSGPASSDTAGPQPQRFAPGVISLDGQVTLSPSFTPDGQTAYFTRAACPLIWQCPQRLYRSEYVDGAWQPAKLVPGLGAFRVDWPSVSPDGKTLIFSWTKPRAVYQGLGIIENFDLFTLDLSDPEARPVAIEGGDINRPRADALKTRRAFHVQSAGTLTSNGDLYFWDERLDAIGERDVFIARKDSAGGYQKAEPLPGPINSSGRDQLGWINPSGTVMLLAYPDRGGEGEDDIFISRRSGKTWSPPQPLGPLVNPPFYDAAARFTPDGEYLVFTSNRPFAGRRKGLLQVWQVATAPLVDAGVLEASDLKP